MSIGRGGVAISEVSREDAGTYICRCHLHGDHLDVHLDDDNGDLEVISKSQTQ